VEIKYAKHYHFTKAQLRFFPLIDKCGIGIWILTDTTEKEYLKLFEAPNWKTFLKPKDKKIISQLYPWFVVEGVKDG